MLDLGSARIVQLLYEPPQAFMDLQIDLFLAESEYHREALSRRIPVNLPGLDIGIFVLSCEDLILHKLMARRIIDRADVLALLRANQKTLDTYYLKKWIRQLDLESDWTLVWAEAYPGTAQPGG
jgi:hypothetical protein